jgi:hypothetical protein
MILAKKKKKVTSVQPDECTSTMNESTVTKF